MAVIANPLPGVTPVQHRALAHDIAERGGAVVTELHSRTRQNGAYFIPRNRIIAGMGEGTVVVESPAGGGALSTAALADGYGRIVMAVPGRAGDRCSAGANRLIMERRAAMVCSGDDIVRELGWDIACPGFIPVRESPPVLNGDERRIMECLHDGEAADMDTLALRSGIPIGQISARAAGAGTRRDGPGVAGEKIRKELTGAAGMRHGRTEESGSPVCPSYRRGRIRNTNDMELIDTHTHPFDEAFDVDQGGGGRASVRSRGSQNDVSRD